MSNYIEQGLYNKILENMVISCVDVCIIDPADKILFVKRNTEPAKNEWWFPGGRVFKGETLKDCAKRKAIEEVGLECDVVSLLNTEETIFDAGPNDIPIHSINCCFLLKPHNLNINLDKYSSEYLWFDY